MKLTSTLSLILIFFLGISIGFSQTNMDKKPFQIFDKKGNSTTYESLYNSCLEADIILFGELHNNSIIHWLQLELSKDLSLDSNVSVVFGAEMFEKHQQMPLNEYLSGVSNFKTFKTETKLWNNTKTDYLPLVDVAKNTESNFTATNVPRILAKQVAKMGLDSFYNILNDSIKELMAPAPIPIDYKAPGYKELLEMDFGGQHGMNTKLMVEAQALKDATMASSILQSFEEGKKYLHFHGNFHSKNWGGIAWYLNEYDKKKRILIISSEESKDGSFNSEWKKSADYIFVTPENMTKTY
ncbi:MAG: ChaN family lipoprotein [Salibacteraceae bacterium]